MTYGKEVTGAVLSGTGSQPGAVLSGGILLANIIGLFKGERYVPSLLKTIAFGAYNKRIENAKYDHAWLSKDEEIIKIYEKDKLCTFDFTVNGYKTLFDSIHFIQKKENIEKVPKELPILFISGIEDPVGDYGKGVEKAYDDFCDAGINNAEMVLYHDCRHELLNEIEREAVYEDVYTWIQKYI